MNWNSIYINYGVTNAFRFPNIALVHTGGIIIYLIRKKIFAKHLEFKLKVQEMD